jgi:hypothetical protein
MFIVLDADIFMLCKYRQSSRAQSRYTYWWNIGISCDRHCMVSSYSHLTRDFVIFFRESFFGLYGMWFIVTELLSPLILLIFKTESGILL